MVGKNLYGRFSVMLILLLLCIKIDAGFTGSLVGGAVGGYIGSSGNKTTIVDNENINMEENSIIMELDTWGEMAYDMSSGKVRILTKPAGGCEGAEYKYVTVEEHVKSIHNNMSGYSMSSKRNGVKIIVRLKNEN